MSMGGPVRVIGLIGVGHHGVGHRRLDGAEEKIGSDHRGDGLATIRASEAKGGAAGGQSGTRNHRRQRVQNMLPRLLPHFIRHSTVRGLAHIGAELLHYRTDTGTLSRARQWRWYGNGTGRKCSCEDGPAAKCHYASPAQTGNALICAAFIALIRMIHVYPSCGSRGMTARHHVLMWLTERLSLWNSGCGGDPASSHRASPIAWISGCDEAGERGSSRASPAPASITAASTRNA